MRVDSWLKIEPDDGLNYDLLMTKLTVPNPEFQSRIRLGYSTNGVRRFDNLYQAVGNELWVPRALAEKYAAKGKNVVDCMSYGHEVDFKSRIQLGPNEKRKEKQEPFVDALTEAVKNSYGAIGQAEAGFGKTVCALEVVARLGRTTAVLVHKEFLMNQWAERVMECYDIDESEIGFVQQNVCDYEGKKIVMIMVQSLLAREYPEELFKYFGTVVVDECFSADTEILTNSGWVRFDALTKNDLVAQYSLDGVSFVKPQRYVERDYNGYLVNVIGKGIDLMLTPGHEQSFLKDTVNGPVLAKEQIKDMSFYYGKSIPTSGKKQTGRRSITPEERFLIAVQADGYVVPSSHKSGVRCGFREVQFSFSKRRKLDRFRKILADCGFSWSEKTVTNNKTRFIVQVPVSLVPHKMFSDWVNLENVSGEWGEEFIKEIVHWDGHFDSRYPERLYYCSTVSENVDIVQAVAAISGYTCTRSLQRDNRKTGYKDVHRLWMWKKVKRDTRSLKKLYVPYTGKVFCVEVPSGHVVVRRNGQVAISGNCHRFGAVEFRKAITMFPSRYRLGITATPRRADGLERVFFWHIGNIAAVGAKRRLKPRIEMVRTNVKPSDLEFRRMKDFRGELTMNKVLDWLVTSEERNRLIVQLLLKAARSGRKVLLLSGRREHLNVLRHMAKSEMAKSGKQFSTGLYVGGMTDEQRSVSAEKQIIFGTYNMAAEGLDIPELDTLFLATPKGDIEQSVGRILRTSDGKKEPVVVDFVDYSIGLCIGLSKKRLKQYQELGYVK